MHWWPLHVSPWSCSLVFFTDCAAHKLPSYFLYETNLNQITCNDYKHWRAKHFLYFSVNLFAVQAVIMRDKLWITKHACEPKSLGRAEFTASNLWFHLLCGYTEKWVFTLISSINIFNSHEKNGCLEELQVNQIKLCCYCVTMFLMLTFSYLAKSIVCQSNYKIVTLLSGDCSVWYTRKVSPWSKLKISVITGMQTNFEWRIILIYSSY